MKHTIKMKNLKAVLFLGLVFGLNLQSTAQTSVEPFLGMWALDLDYENSNAGWLEVTREDGYLDAELLWRWGSVYAIDYTLVKEDYLLLVHGEDVVRKKDEKGNPVRTTHPVNWFELKKEGDDMISGSAVFPEENGIGVEMVSFTGKRIPAYGKAPESAKIKYGKAVKLFNGRDLDGWELLDKGATSGWKVVDGVMVNDPVQKKGEQHIHYGNLRTVDTFEDFNLKVEVNIPAGNNSGIYLRGIYEVQVLDSFGKELDSHNLGALYSRITPLVAAEKPAGEWQELDITLYKRHITIILNGKTLIENQPVKGITGGAITSDEFIPGPIYLQGDHGKVSFRSILLTPILK